MHDLCLLIVCECSGEVLQCFMTRNHSVYLEVRVFFDFFRVVGAHF